MFGSESSSYRDTAAMLAVQPQTKCDRSCNARTLHSVRTFRCSDSSPPVWRHHRVPPSALIFLTPPENVFILQCIYVAMVTVMSRSVICWCELVCDYSSTKLEKNWSQFCVCLDVTCWQQTGNISDVIVHSLRWWSRSGNVKRPEATAARAYWFVDIKHLSDELIRQRRKNLEQMSDEEPMKQISLRILKPSQKFNTFFFNRQLKVDRSKNQLPISLLKKLSCKTSTSGTSRISNRPSIDVKRSQLRWFWNGRPGTRDWVSLLGLTWQKAPRTPTGCLRNTSSPKPTQ